MLNQIEAEGGLAESAGAGVAFHGTMGRGPRIQFSGACYHLINRGNYRRDIFAHPGTAAAFERCLFEMCEKMDWRLHAYVVMRNHFHLAAETSGRT